MQSFHPCFFLASTVSVPDALQIHQARALRPPVVELRRPSVDVACDSLGGLQAASVLQKARDARGPEAVAAKVALNVRVFQATAHHRPHVPTAHRPGGELPVRPGEARKGSVVRMLLCPDLWQMVPDRGGKIATAVLSQSQRPPAGTAAPPHDGALTLRPW